MPSASDFGPPRLRYWRTYTRADDSGPAQATHLEGIGDAYALCGKDVSGDDLTHRKPPECLPGRARITCPDCLQIVALVRAHLAQ